MNKKILLLDHIPKTTLFEPENIILFINDYQKVLGLLGNKALKN